MCQDEGHRGLDWAENAAGKKLCGMCAYKLKGKWECSVACNGKSIYICPRPYTETVCPGFIHKPLHKKGTQGGKKKGLPVPPGVKFLYVGRPKDRGPDLGWGHREHHGVVTVAWITAAPGILHLGFSFCSPKDPWCKIIGRDMAASRLLTSYLTIPYLYDAKRTVREVVRAILSHDFDRLDCLTSPAKAYEIIRTVPSWTKALAKRMDTREITATEINRGRLSHPKPTASQVVARIMADIAKLER